MPPPSTVSPELVEAARSRGDVVGALASALDAWREEREPAIAALVDALSAEALTTFAPPRADSARAFQMAWLEAARTGDSIAMGWVATSLRSRLPREVRARGPFGARVRALAALPPDPRFALALVDVLLAMPFPSQLESEYDEAVALVVALGDLRVLPVLRDLLARPRARVASSRDWLENALPPAIRKLVAMERPPSPRREAWQALARSVRPGAEPGSPSGTEDPGALLARIRADPDDEGARLVYADWLQERGHPLGELIVLQCAIANDAATSTQRTRAASILHKHRRDWLGELALVLIRPEFERGFLASAELARNAAATADAWQRAAADPLLSTVHTLGQGSGSISHYASFVVSPVAGNVRHVNVPRWSFLEVLLEAGRPRRLTSLALPRRPPRATMTRIAARLPITTLDVPLRPGEASAFFADLDASGLLAKLASVRVSARGRGVGLVRGEALASAPVSLGELSCEGCTILRSPRGAEVVVDDAVAEAPEIASMLPRDAWIVRVVRPAPRSGGHTLAALAAARGIPFERE